MALPWEEGSTSDHAVPATLFDMPRSVPSTVNANTGDASAEAKLRGGYYTPDVLADFLVRWALADGAKRVLEPSAGNGGFVRALRAHKRSTLHVDAVELYESEARQIELPTKRGEVVTGDALGWYRQTRPDPYDAVVGNPPFVRYQTFPEEHRESGFALMHEEGLSPNRLTNAWVPFVVLATKALRPGGRLAMVVPAELLQVTYAGELRAYLARKFSHVWVVTFRRLVFPDIQQETVLLLGTKASDDTSDPALMSFIELDDLEDLAPTTVEGSEAVKADLQHDREKWTQYYLSPKELGLIREIEDSDSFTTLGELADVDVGVVTGRNEFFVLTPSEARRRGVEESCLRLVGRSAQIPGLVISDEEWLDLEQADSKCLLMQLGRTPREQLTESARAYVEHGEAEGFHTGYKCKIRLPEWWYVPSTAIPDAFLLRQIHDGPRIVLNGAGATSTDTIHRVRVQAGVDPGWLAAASMNSVTFAFSEVRGRSYGGGVLELEPNEADALPFPQPGVDLPLADLDLWARRKEPIQVLDEVDRLVLKAAGLTTVEATEVREIWRKLSSRRGNRKRRPKSG